MIALHGCNRLCTDQTEAGTDMTQLRKIDYGVPTEESGVTFQQALSDAA
ncbi:MAG: hypothetical protein QGF09_06525 [Rhodospirillales bacterium]|nr:hypothetical protein [Rhodospirillales bacterium]